jgi:hypothetical protein
LLSTGDNGRFGRLRQDESPFWARTDIRAQHGHIPVSQKNARRHHRVDGTGRAGLHHPSRQPNPLPESVPTHRTGRLIGSSHRHRYPPTRPGPGDATTHAHPRRKPPTRHRRRTPTQRSVRRRAEQTPALLTWRGPAAGGKPISPMPFRKPTGGTARRRRGICIRGVRRRPATAGATASERPVESRPCSATTTDPYTAGPPR